MRALIVDDSNFIREYVRRHLEQFGWTCAEAHNGSEALGVLRGDAPGKDAGEGGKHFDVMLVDVNMPVMNGLECVKQLREQRLAPGMKVMMVTTEADHSFIRRALENGADEFLMKPFSGQSLREKLMLLGFEAAA
jgi:two-component system chemotaxis response regulator CheY